MLTDTKNSEGHRLTFFEKPVSYYYGDDVHVPGLQKTGADTNLNQSSMLDYPRVFDVTGLGVFFERGISEEDEAALVNNASVRLIMYGNRLYYETPLLLLPNFGDIEQVTELAKTPAPVRIGNVELDASLRVPMGFMPLHALKSTYLDPMKSPDPDAWDQQRTALANGCFRIKPGEAFNVVIEWSKPPRLSKPRKIMVALDGYMWQPL